MPTKTWKKNELSWKSIGGKRNHFEHEDVSHPLFSIECKHRSIQNYPKSVRNWYQQALENTAEGKIPLLAIHLAGEIRGNDLVILRRSDFEDLLGKLNPHSCVCAAPGEEKTQKTGTDPSSPDYCPF